VQNKNESNTKIGDQNKHEPTDEYVKKILKIEEEHFRKYRYRTMSMKEMDELFGK